MKKIILVILCIVFCIYSLGAAQSVSYNAVCVVTENGGGVPTKFDNSTRPKMFKKLDELEDYKRNITVYGNDNGLIDKLNSYNFDFFNNKILICVSERISFSQDYKIADVCFTNSFTKEVCVIVNVKRSYNAKSTSDSLIFLIEVDKNNDIEGVNVDQEIYKQNEKDGPFIPSGYIYPEEDKRKVDFETNTYKADVEYFKTDWIIFDSRANVENIKNEIPNNNINTEFLTKLASYTNEFFENNRLVLMQTYFFRDGHKINKITAEGEILQVEVKMNTSSKPLPPGTVNGTQCWFIELENSILFDYVRVNIARQQSGGCSSVGSK